MLQKTGSIRRGLVAAVGTFILGAALTAAAPAKAGDHHSSFFFGFGVPLGGYYGPGPAYYGPPAYPYPPPYAYGPAYAYAPPAPQYQQQQGYCREFQTTIVVDGHPQAAHGTACQQPDGTWQVVN